MEIFRLKNLSFHYPGADRPALDNVTLSVESGEFVVVCGQSGCGKTTLLRMLKRELTPHGEQSGRVLYCGGELAGLDARAAAGEIGFVAQNPEAQIVTDKVWHELSFGLESRGLPTPVIRRRVGEMASFFGIQSWFRQETASLSGGQKQLLNLASVMVMQPRALILDEPTSQLDPIAAADFIATLQKLNRELGLTILLVEHRLEEVFPIADRVLVLENAKAVAYDEPRRIGGILRATRPDHPMLQGLPSAVRIFSALDAQGECPLTVKEGRSFLAAHYTNEIAELPEPPAAPQDEIIAELREVWFRYERELPDVLRGVSLQVRRGEVFCILGGNGTGKTTTLNVLAGLKHAYRGKALVAGKPIESWKGGSLYHKCLAMLPQNPQSVFLKDTVLADLTEAGRAMGHSPDEAEAGAQTVAQRLGIGHLLNKHPFDLSGGEQQKCALAKMLMLEPRVLLLDEPTKGIDAFAKQALQEILRDLAAEGLAVVMVTHDVEFAALCADRCALFFDGEILSSDAPRAFFSQNNFYTTAANRIARSLYPTAVTCAEVVELCRQNGERHD